MIILAFCKSCGNLLRPKKNSKGVVEVKCDTCSDNTESIASYLVNEQFYNKLKNIFRSGRAEKQLKTISRTLSMPESEVHEILKALDDEGRLPYGYYDKIERLYVRTHLTDDIPDELMLDMIKQCYGYEIFGAKGLCNYISLGKNTSVRKVLQSLHGLRKKNLIRGYKKNVNWLFRLSQLNEDPSTPFFPKKSKLQEEPPKVEKEMQDQEESDQVDEDVEDYDYDPDEEEEQDDSKMVYFADPDDED